MKKAFTLSEVMLVLSVIGVIAALTIPGLIQSTQNKQLVTKLKKEYSVLSQAYTAVASNNDGDITSVFAGGSNSDDANVMNIFATNLNVLKNCGNAAGCWYTTPFKWLGGGIADANLDNRWGTSFGKAILADGAILLVDSYGLNCTSSAGSTPVGSPLYTSVCGTIDIDVNGNSGPNQHGRDYFKFWITKTGIYPNGSYNDGQTCDIAGTSWATNQGCAAKILQEGAMNY